MAKGLPQAPALIASAWEYYRKQPVLNAIVPWMLILPMVAGEWIRRVQEYPAAWEYFPHKGWTMEYMLAGLVLLLLSVVTFWGMACVLLVGKRMIQNKSGRIRFSFKAVRREALPFLVPLFLTSLLQLCMLLYWGLLFVIPAVIFILINPCGIGGSSLAKLPGILGNCSTFYLLTPLLLPGIIYYIRTFFFDVIVVCEELKYRSALKRSIEIVRGHTGQALWRLFGIVVLVMLPAGAVTWGITAFVETWNPRFFIAGELIADAIRSIAIVLFSLSCMALFGALRKYRQESRPQRVFPA